MSVLRLTRGPLRDVEYDAIRAAYDRLTDNTTSPRNFRRWLVESPAGPAFHAIVENDGVIAGHCCLIPIPFRVRDQSVVAAKAEYLFLEKSSRREPIEGLSSRLPPSVTLLRALYEAAARIGWGPYFLSAPPEVARVHRMAGCRPMLLPLHECLLTLRPVAAALGTPNLTSVRRAAMLAVGLAQQGGRLFVPLVGTRSVDAGPVARPPLQLPEDDAFRSWRYDPAEYAVVRVEGAELIVKRGGASSYARVIEARVSGSVDIRSMLRQLVAIAHAGRALGVRWAIYDDGAIPKEIIAALKRNGFVCVRRTRELLTYAEGSERVLAPGSWDANDFYVTFDTA